jgi:hypothetical protein
MKEEGDDSLAPRREQIMMQDSNTKASAMMNARAYDRDDAFRRGS